MSKNMAVGCWWWWWGGEVLVVVVVVVFFSFEFVEISCFFFTFCLTSHVAKNVRDPELPDQGGIY
jgi:hypothetical protein